MVSKKIFVTGFVFLLLLGLAAADMRIFVDSQNPEDYLLIGNLFYSESKQAAEGLYEKGLEFDPQDSKLHNNLGMTLMEQGDTQGAIEEWMIAKELAPQDPDPRQNLANIFHLLGQHKDAIDELQGLLDIDADNPSYHYDLAINIGELVRQGDYSLLEECINHFERADQLSPGYERAKENIEVLESIRLSQ